MELRLASTFVLLILAAVIKSNLSDVCETEGFGFHCDGCTRMVFCIPNGGNWITQERGLCDESQNLYCNELEKNCSTTKNCSTPVVTPDVPFKCNNLGVFPNPYDCKIYHICTKSTSTNGFVKDDVKCPDGYAFNPLKNLCDERVANSQLCKPQYTCNELYEMAAWPTNRNIFYICMEGRSATTKEKYLYPDLYTCDSDQIFDDQTQQCMLENDIIPTTTTESNVNKTTLTPPTPSDKCTTAGIFEDPNNCRGYIYCTSRLQRIVRTCPTNTHFNNTIKSCVAGFEC